jgi:hypothetical protein
MWLYSLVWYALLFIMDFYIVEWTCHVFHLLGDSSVYKHVSLPWREWSNNEELFLFLASVLVVMPRYIIGKKINAHEWLAREIGAPWETCW